MPCISTYLFAAKALPGQPVGGGQGSAPSTSLRRPLVPQGHPKLMSERGCAENERVQSASGWACRNRRTRPARRRARRAESSRRRASQRPPSFWSVFSRDGGRGRFRLGECWLPPRSRNLTAAGDPSSYMQTPARQWCARARQPRLRAQCAGPPSISDLATVVAVPAAAASGYRTCCCARPPAAA